MRAIEQPEPAFDSGSVGRCAFPMYSWSVSSSTADGEGCWEWTLMLVSGTGFTLATLTLRLRQEDWEIEATSFLSSLGYVLVQTKLIPTKEPVSPSSVSLWGGVKSGAESWGVGLPHLVPTAFQRPWIAALPCPGPSCQPIAGRCVIHRPQVWFLKEWLYCSEWFSGFFVLSTVAVKFFGPAKGEKGADSMYK